MARSRFTARTDGHSIITCKSGPNVLNAVSVRNGPLCVFIIGAVWVCLFSFAFHPSLTDISEEGLQPDDTAASTLLLDQIARNETSESPKLQKAGEEARKQVPLDPKGFRFNKQVAEDVLSALGPSSIRKTLSAYVEPPMKDEVPGTGTQGDPENKKDHGTPPDFVVPLPLRNVTPESLTKFEYPKLQTCHNLQANLPVDRGLDFRKTRREENLEDPMAEAPYCPVDADPFLPWLHDVFPSADGTMVHFVAQNKRRCNSGWKFQKDVKRLEPQVSIMQPISVKRLDEQEARRMAPQLWYPEDVEEAEVMPRYRLASFEDADSDGQLTRFVCRFHTTVFSTASAPRSLILGETLSTYPFNYEFMNHRKGLPPVMLTPRGKDNSRFWLSTFRFDCPLPQREELRRLVASGDSVLSDGTPTIHLDLVPLRTSPRFKEVHFPEGTTDSKMVSRFDPNKWWGDRNVMPRVEASGRWENIPICWPPQPTEIGKEDKVGRNVQANVGGLHLGKEKPHTLVACTWASAKFSTRGNHASISDGIARLGEWIEYHLLVGFDHIYVYDNSGAHTNEKSLAETVAKFSPKQVTRIDWPSQVCNNNIISSDNLGERSSQYAAESSCLQRFGPFTEWLASFDTDEYLVPMGKYMNLKDILRDAAKGGTQILNFMSTKSFPDRKFMEPYLENDYCTEGEKDCLQKRRNATFLETYNCDSQPLPKPKWAHRAKKEIFRPSYVLHHHIHYSTVTRKSVEIYKDATPGTWKRRFSDKAPIDRSTNETDEALMLHAKASIPEGTKWQLKQCRRLDVNQTDFCDIGNPWPNNVVRDGAIDGNGFRYNCFTNERLTNVWIPRLLEAMEKRGTRPTR